ncbi:MAG: ORF6N domain-containing protein [Rikenellaceae bacterium]
MGELEVIQSKIYEVRGHRIMLDKDLAELYQVETKVLNQTVKRNIKRFPSDFMFQLTTDEFINLKSQFVTSSWGGTRKLPYVFTEQGLAMLSGLLNSDVAINVNISIMRAFVEMRKYLTSIAPLSAELAELRTKLQLLERNDEENMSAINDLSEDLRRDIDNIYNAIGELSVKTPKLDSPRRAIGYKIYHE